MESVQKYMKYRQFYIRICYTKSNVTNVNTVRKEIKEEIWRKKNYRTAKKEEDVVSEVRSPHM